MNRILLILLLSQSVRAATANVGLLSVGTVSVNGIAESPASSYPIDYFPSGGTNLIQIEFVTIPASDNDWNTNFVFNSPDKTGEPTNAGKVTYGYRMSKWKVSVAEITAWKTANPALSWLPPLNANGWDDDTPWMTYNQVVRMRFANWLNDIHGKQRAYNFDGEGYWQMWPEEDSLVADGRTNRFRHKDAFYWVPSVDEYHKAMFWDADNSKYWAYHFGSDSTPTYTSTPGTTAGTIVGGYEETPELGPPPVLESGGLSLNGLGCIGAAWDPTDSAADGYNDDNSNDEWITVLSGKWYTGVYGYVGSDHERPYGASVPGPLGYWNTIYPTHPNCGMRIGSKIPE